MTTRQTTIRFAERTDAQVAELVPMFGTVTNVVQVAIDRMHREEIDRLMGTRGEQENNDRVAQVNWLNNLAANIAHGVDDQSIAAEELVAYALGDEGRDDLGIEIPEWFDDHDRALLVRWVGESLS